MSEINYQALREVAEAVKEKTTWQSLQAFRAAATPEVVLALLDVLERRSDGREAVAVAWKVTFTQVDQESNTFTAMYSDKAEVERWVRLHEIGDYRAEITPLYAAPVVPEEISMSSSLPLMSDQLMALGYVKGWNACREAMLQGKGE